MKIAGKNTDTDWFALKAKITQTPNDVALWEEAYKRFYCLRIETRYLKPIASIREEDDQNGEGFAIAALFCSLIEFLETCEQGHVFKLGADNKLTHQTNEYTIGVGGKYFRDFLTTREPFKNHFTPVIAKDFFDNLRCPLLHEARTQAGWYVSSESSKGKLFEQRGGHKVLFRNDLVPALQTYFRDYRGRLVTQLPVQQAFVRKFDHLATA